MNKLIKIRENDNVGVALEKISCGQRIMSVTARDEIPVGHKLALRDIPCGESVFKYGYPIGRATRDISAGEWVHTHNLKSDINVSDEYEYIHTKAEKCKQFALDVPSFMGYERADGSVGVRNEIWVLPLVGCVNKIVQKIERAAEVYADSCDGVYAFTHPYGCSQLGDDHEATRELLAGLCKNPNAAGVLLVGLGCENNTLESFLPLLGEFDRDRIKTLTAQKCEDEVAEGLRLIGEIVETIKKDRRTSVSADRLVVGMKCGGSDAFSGITANPLCGRLSDCLTHFGARVLLTETPEMFGAETLLMNRASNRKVFNDTVEMINTFKKYFAMSGQPVYENPSPGNKEGGITTLEEKSLGCIQKGGVSAVTGVLKYAQKCVVPGLNLISGPGNDIVSCTNLAASGAQIILFTTGRGTPLGAPVPTLKLSSNSALYERKPNWIDFDAGSVINNGFDDAQRLLLELLMETANGNKTKSEQNGCREIAIFKNGVTM